MLSAGASDRRDAMGWVRESTAEIGNRGVSTVVGYSITVIITTLLVTGLIIGIGGFVNDQRERAVRGELEVVGSQLASDLTALDQLVRGGVATGGSPTSLTLESQRPLPSTAAGVSYRVSFEDRTGGTGADVVVLSTESPDVNVTARLATTEEVPVRPTRLAGGDVNITFDGSSPPPGAIGELVVTDA